jgi:hypothetical protein
MPNQTVKTNCRPASRSRSCRVSSDTYSTCVSALSAAVAHLYRWSTRSAGARAFSTNVDRITGFDSRDRDGAKRAPTNGVRGHGLSARCWHGSRQRAYRSRRSSRFAQRRHHITFDPPAIVASFSVAMLGAQAIGRALHRFPGMTYVVVTMVQQALEKSGLCTIMVQKVLVVTLCHTGGAWGDLQSPGDHSCRNRLASYAPH